MQTEIPSSSSQQNIGYTDRINLPGHTESAEHPDCYFVNSEKLCKVAAYGIRNFPEEALTVIDESRLKEKVEIFQENFLPSQPNRRIAYAVKANPRRKILEVFGSAGITDFDCASGGEIEHVLSVDPSAEIFFNNPIKTKRDIALALRHQIRHFTVQSREEVEKILQVYGRETGGDRADLEIVVRLASQSTSAKINLSEKFGTDFDSALQILTSLRAETKAKIGASIHVGSQNRDVSSHEAGVSQISKLDSLLSGLDVINLGGGFPVDYQLGSDRELKNYLFGLSDFVEKKLANFLQKSKKIIVEPGRALVADAAHLFVPVIGTEQRAEKKLIYIGDGVFTSFSDAVIHDWKYDFQPVYLNHQNQKNYLQEEVVLHGRTCDSGDTLGDVFLPAMIQSGDYLHVPYSGAYHDSQSTRFNGFEPPKYLFFNSKSKCQNLNESTKTELTTAKCQLVTA